MRVGTGSQRTWGGRELDGQIASLLYTLHRGMGHDDATARSTALQGLALLKREIGSARVYLARNLDPEIARPMAKLLRDQGKTIREIARAMGISQRTAYRLLSDCQNGAEMAVSGVPA